MEVLSQLDITSKEGLSSMIQLLQGDLSALPAEHATDILILSAYPGSYIPVPHTLIAALEEKGISVEELAKHKSIDLRDQLGCWMSQPLSAEQQAKCNIKKILCFEPWHHADAQTEVVGNIFRCINTFAYNEANNVIAMPVLASGQQNVPFEKMLPALLDVCVFWLEAGLPIHAIKLVVHSDEQANIALPIFNRVRDQNLLKQSVISGNLSAAKAIEQIAVQKQQSTVHEEPLPIMDAELNALAGVQAAQKTNDGAGIQPPPRGAKSFVPEAATTAPATLAASQQTDQYDYFISYAHTHADLINSFVEKLSEIKKDLRVFYDKSSIPPGGLWIKQISDAIQKAKNILIFLSPDYSKSPVCWDEFQCAKLVEYNSKRSMIQTVYLYNDDAMPPIMGIYSWTDCREGDAQKLAQIASSLLTNKSLN